MVVRLGRFFGRVLHRNGAVLGWLVVLSAFSVNANPGLDWLATQQAPDGSYGRTPTSLATTAQSTSEVLSAQLALGQTAAPSCELALGALNAQPGADIDLLARKIALNAQLDLATRVPILPLINQLTRHQHRSGGFGAVPGGAPSVFDTAVALEALSIATPTAPQTGTAVAFLLARQQTDGAWADGANEPSVYLTALSLRALGPYRSTYGGVATALTRAQNFLLSRKAADGLWGEDFRSATSLLALVPLVADLSLVDASAQALQARQQSNGSWVDDPFTTALALQALKAYDARKSGSTPAAGGSLTGYVVRAGSTEPIEGATITVAQVPGVAVRTNADGYYVLPGLPAGSYTVTAQKVGYSSASAIVVTRANQVTIAPQLVLDVLAQTGLVSGLVFDAETHQPLQAVQVSLAGAASFSVLTQSTGEFDFGPIAPGAYVLRFEKTGYLTMSGTVTVEAGRTLSAQLGLTRAGGYVDGTPGTVSGRAVDGKTGQPLAGALFVLGGSLSTTTGADGTFTIASVPRSTYQGTLSAAGYRSATFSLVFPPGASGDMGTLSLYPEAATTPPTSLTLRGLIADGVSNAPIPGATVALTETGASTTAGTDGRFVLSGITLQSFHLALSAAGYQSATYTMQISAFGEAEVTLKLSPPGSGATSSQIAGTVTDAETGQPVSGAQVAVAGTSLTATTDNDGHYTLGGIGVLEFVVNVSAVGFAQQQLGVKLASHGNYTLNAALSPVAGESFQVVSVAAQQNAYGANATALFTTRIASLLSASYSVLVLGEVQDAVGATVATVSPYAEGTTTPASQFNFDAGELKQLTIPWNTQQFPPGTYRLVVRVSEPGTISRGAPFGQVLAENAARTSVVPNTGISGAMALNPPITQAGLPTPVSFSALVRNAGNVPLPAMAYVLTVTSPKTGVTLFTAEASASELAVGNNTTVSFGSWVPTEAGNLPVTVRATDTSIPGEITHRLYVGDKASGTFTVSRNVVPEGDQTVRGTLSLQGVDTTQGGSTDPLFALVKESVKRAGAYTGTEGVAWTERGRCLGCHIQTQSLLGLSSAIDKAEINPAQTRYLFNAITTSVYADGSSAGGGKTETALALWSLGAWRDLATSFRAKYKSAQYLQSQRSTASGNQTYWTPSHASGWWDTYVAETALVVKGYVDVLKSAEKLPAAGVPDYALETVQSLGPTWLPTDDLTVGPDGALYLARSGDGSVQRVDLTTGQLTSFATNLGTVSGIAFAPDGTLYVSRNLSSNALLRINSDGSRTTIAVGGNPLDVAVGPDGGVYLPDRNSNRIHRVNAAGQVEVYVSGGLLNRPHSLGFDTEGNLLVTNPGSYNILKVARTDRGVSKYFEGMTSQPVRLARTADGSVYMTVAGPNGLIRVNPDGTGVRALHLSNNLTGIAAVGETLYLIDQTTYKLMRLSTSQLNTSALATFRAELPNAARYLLANTDEPADNVVRAMRLIGLAEARTVITDATMLGQINARITSEATVLRSRQRGDGGWNREGGGSDPLTTAMVGLALEYTDPSPQDVQIRSAIQYLLNTQQADGSWPSIGNGLGTRLASTSFVMVFMPKALERLGGIDIDLYVELPANIQLSNGTLTPVVEDLAGGGTRNLWKLLGVTGQGREVAFDLQMRAMALGEQRAAATRAYLEFKNSFVDERIQLPLEVPLVSVTSGATLAVATDKAWYLPEELVSIPATVTNTSQAPSSGKVALTLRAAGGTEPIALLPLLPFTNLAPGAQVTLTGSWNTGATLAGSYEVEARLLDAHNRVLARAVTPFEIRAPLQAVSTVVTTNKPIYEAWDAVAITGRIRNVAPNAPLDSSRVEVTVQAPDGTPIFSGVRTLTQLVPGARVDVPFGLKLSDAADGTYRVTLVLQDAFTRAPLSTSETTFQVVRRLVTSLTGSVTVEFQQVYVGDPNVCTATARSAAASAVPGVQLIHQLLHAETGTVVDETSETVDLAVGQPHSTVRNISTQGLAPGGYACVLQAQLEGTRRTLGFAGFQVLEPPIKIVAALSSGGKGRLLVLLDNPSTSQGPAEPFGPTGAPNLTAQRPFLEALLTRAGWSYTITETADDFTREFHTGGYAVYALFSEREKLAVQTQKELREAINRGEGLLIAGSHDSRNHGNYESLGVRFIGHLSQLDTVVLAAPEFPLLTGELDLLEGELPIRFELEGAESLGYYRENEGLGHHALTLHGYGRGMTAFAGPDLLAIATRDGQESTAAAVLRALLDRVHPESLAFVVGAVVPVQLDVTNQGIAVAVTAAVPIPAGVSLVDAGQGTLEGQLLRFAFPLAEGETRSLRFWVRLPVTAGPVTLQAEVTASQGSSSKSVTASLTIAVQPAEELAGIVTQLDALGASSHSDAKIFREAATHLRNALRRPALTLAVKDALIAIDRLLGSTSSEAAELRIAIDSWMWWALRQSI